MRKKLTVFALVLALLVPLPIALSSREAKAAELIDGRPGSYDVVVYGASSAGVTAAIAAKREGADVLLISQNNSVGGLTSNGLGATDIANKNVVGGIAREFYHRVYEWYKDDSAWTSETREEYFKYVDDAEKTPIYGGKDDSLEMMWVFEPKVAQRIFREMLIADGVPVAFNQPLDLTGGITTEGGRITAIRSTDGSEYRAKVFIDASYEGDLMAKAGVTYRIGREANSEYGETMNGILPNKNEFASVSPYIVPGAPDSGLLPFIESGSLGQAGESDGRVQAYCFRFTLSTDPDNRMPITKPENYHPEWYESRARQLMANPNLANELTQNRMPNNKTDTNHADFVGNSYEYADGDYLSRVDIAADHRNYALGLLYFYAYDERVPEKMRLEMREFGLAKDEFTDNGNFPVEIYLREGRRMVSDYVMKESDVIQNSVEGVITKTTAPYSVGQGFYWFDSHRVAYYAYKGGVMTDGNFWSTRRDYPISYQSVTPKKAECENLFVPVCMSATHAAYGSIRMETTYMIVAESCGTAAAMSAAKIAGDADFAVQDLNYKELAIKLSENGQLLGDIKAPNLSEGDNIILQLAVNGLVNPAESDVLTAAFNETAFNAPERLTALKAVLLKAARAVYPDADETTAVGTLVKMGVISNPSSWNALFSDTPPVSMPYDSVKSVLDKVNLNLKNAVANGIITTWLDYLREKGIIGAEDFIYFDAHAIGGQSSDTRRTLDMLVAIARTVDPAATDDTALQVFVNTKIIGNAAVWKDVFDGSAAGVNGTNLNGLIKNVYKYLLGHKELTEGKLGVYYANLLVRAGIVNDDEARTLIAGARAGKTVASALAKKILVGGAQYLDYTATEDTALSVLRSAGVIDGAAVWDNVLTGSDIAGNLMLGAAQKLAVASLTVPVVTPVTDETMQLFNDLNMIADIDNQLWIEGAVRGGNVDGGKAKTLIERTAGRISNAGTDPVGKLVLAGVIDEGDAELYRAAQTGSGLNGTAANALINSLFGYIETNNLSLSGSQIETLVTMGVLSEGERDAFTVGATQFGDVEKQLGKRVIERLGSEVDATATTTDAQLDALVKIAAIGNKADWTDKFSNDNLTVLSGLDVYNVFNKALNVIGTTFSYYDALAKNGVLTQEDADFWKISGNDGQFVTNGQMTGLLILYGKALDPAVTDGTAAVAAIKAAGITANDTVWLAYINGAADESARIAGLANMTQKVHDYLKPQWVPGLSDEVLDYFETVKNAAVSNGIFGNGAATKEQIKAWARDIGPVVNFTNTRNVVYRAMWLIHPNKYTKGSTLVNKIIDLGFTFSDDATEHERMAGYWRTTLDSADATGTIDGHELQLVLARIYDFMNPSI